jgi:hypothetical protein
MFCENITNALPLAYQNLLLQTTVAPNPRLVDMPHTVTLHRDFNTVSVIRGIDIYTETITEAKQRT